MDLWLPLKVAAILALSFVWLAVKGFAWRFAVEQKNARLAAIEARAERAQEAWRHGDIATLRTLTLEDIPWLLEQVGSHERIRTAVLSGRDAG